MTIDEILQIAREVDIGVKALPDDYCDDFGLVRGAFSRCEIGIADLQRFASKVEAKTAAAERQAIDNALLKLFDTGQVDARTVKKLTAAMKKARAV